MMMVQKKKKKAAAAPVRKMPSAGDLALDLCLFVFTVGLLFLVKFQMSPIISSVTFSAKNQESFTHMMPSFFDSFGDVFDASLTITVPRLHTSVFAVQVDDCIDELSVNGKKVIPDQLPVLCSPHDFSRVNLGPYLHSGENQLHMRISDIGVTGGINIISSNTDPFLLFLQLASLFSIGWFAFRLRSSLSVRRRPSFSMMILFLAFVFLRVFYANATSYHLRAHDTEGHVEYIQYVNENATIPHAADGWEFHQPPLYYASAALLRSVGLKAGFSDHQILQVLSGISVGLSAIVLYLLFSLAEFLFKPKERWSFVGYALLVGSACRLLLLAPNITNEALAVPLVLLFLSLLLRWWSAPERISVFALALLFSLAFLTKISAILFLPVVLSCFFLHPTLPLRRKMASFVLFLSMTAFLTGWYPAYRFFMEPSSEKTVSLGNDGMDPGLRVPRDAKHLLTFNPVQMITHPYNNPWDDEARRGYFLEYFFRSALFGEFYFERMKVLSYPIVGLGLALLIPFALGFLSALRRSFVELWPLHITFASLLAGACLYPYLFPFAPNQDFRFSVALTAPIAYYVICGIRLQPRALRLVFGAILGVFASLCTVFYGSLFFLS